MLDLADGDTRRALGVDDALLRLAWRHQRDVLRREPESWAFADAAIDGGFEGLCVPSATGRGTNLVLWRWGATGARVGVVDPNAELG